MSVMGAGTGRRGGTRPGAGAPRGPHKQTLANIEKVRASRDLTAERVLEQIRRGALFDIRKLFDARGAFKGIHNLTEEEATCIAGVDMVRGNINKNDGVFDDVLKIRFIGDRAKYVEMAAKYHGLLVDRLAIEDDKPLRVKVADARRRLAAAKGKG